MKKLVIIEFIFLIICSVSAFVLFDQKRSFQSELIQKERTVELNLTELKQLDLWRRRLEKLKEALE